MSAIGPGEYGSVTPRPEVASAILGTAGRSGVERLWFVSGSELTSIQEATARAVAVGEPTPRLMTCTHEHVALSAALGECMVTGAPSMTAGHADLGLLHQGGAIHNAMWGSHPVLMLSGYPPTTPDSRDSSVFWKQQRWDPGEIVRQYVKWDYRLGALDDAAMVTARALQVALSPRPGPVYLAMPAEVGRIPAGPAGVTSAQELGIPRLGPGDPAGIEDVARHLLAAENPLLVTDRVGENPDAVAHLDALATDFGIGVRSSRFRMSIRDDHPCKVGTSVGAADMVLVLEHPVPWVPAEETPDRDAWVAWVGTDPVESEIPLYEFPAALRMIADPAAFLLALRDAMERCAGPGDRKRARRRYEALEGRHRPAAAGPVVSQTDQPTSDQLVQSLGDVLAPDDIVTWEVVNTARLRRTRPGTMFEKGGSSLGWSVAAAVGARIASGDQPTVALAGDGAYLFGSPDSCLWLQQEHDAPVLTIVINNGGYRTGTTTLAKHYPDGYAVAQDEIVGGHLTRTPDLAAHARSQGGYGETVEKAAEVEAAITRARHAVERDRIPAVLDVRVPQHLRPGPRRPVRGPGPGTDPRTAGATS